MALCSIHIDNWMMMSDGLRKELSEILDSPTGFGHFKTRKLMREAREKIRELQERTDKPIQLRIFL